MTESSAVMAAASSFFSASHSETRARFAKRFGSILRYLVVDPAQFLIERKWLLEIKSRAEELARLRTSSEPLPSCPLT